MSLAELPLVSVVIPTYDRPEMVRRAVGSVLAQGVPVEVIVVDDGSPEPYSAEGIAQAELVRVLRQPQCLGVSAARNRGMAAARGEYVAFLDDDDLWLPGKLSHQLERMAAAGSRWSFTGTSAVDEQGRQRYAYLPNTLGSQSVGTDNPIPSPSTVLVERELLWASGGFSSSLSVLADWDLWIRLSQIEQPLAVDEPLVQYVLHDGAMHVRNIGESLHDRRVLRRRYGAAGRIGGYGFWLWTARSQRHAGTPVRGLLLVLYVAARYPRQFARELAPWRRLAIRFGRTGRGTDA